MATLPRASHDRLPLPDNRARPNAARPACELELEPGVAVRSGSPFDVCGGPAYLTSFEHAGQNAQAPVGATRQPAGRPAGSAVTPGHRAAVRCAISSARAQWPDRCLGLQSKGRWVGSRSAVSSTGAAVIQPGPPTPVAAAPVLRRNTTPPGGHNQRIQAEIRASTEASLTGTRLRHPDSEPRLGIGRPAACFRT